EELAAYKVRPAPDTLPDRWMTGTQNHEGIAGVTAAVDYLADIGARHPEYDEPLATMSPRRHAIYAGLMAIRRYEAGLANELLVALAQRPRRFKVWGITDRGKLYWRVPTIAVTHEGRTPEEMAEHLARRHIYVWSGNMYALELTELLGLEGRGGLLR